MTKTIACVFHTSSAMDFTTSLHGGASPPVEEHGKIHSTACMKNTGTCAHENTIPKQNQESYHTDYDPHTQTYYQEPKKNPNQTFWGNFVDRKVWGNFGQWGVKKMFGCSGFAVSFFSLWGACHPP